MSAEAQTDLPPLAAPWGGESRTVDLGGQVHYVDFGEPHARPDAPVVVLVHGLGGSHLNWVLLGQRLRETHRVYALDLAGFGFTRMTEELPASVGHNAKLVRRFVTEVVGEPVVLIGNSMGGLISVMVASREGAPVRGLVLIDPALPAPRGRPDAQAISLFTLLGAPVRRAIRTRRGRPVSIAAEVAAVLRICFARWDRLDEEVFEAHVDLAKAQRGYRELNAAFKVAGRTMIEALARRGAVRRRLAAVDLPVLLVQGDRDRLVHVSAARWAARMNPGWEYEEMAGVGHVPMLEVPDRTAETISRWMSTHVDEQG